jgi:diguanylate cyclase (GGDEF)-like protein
MEIGASEQIDSGQIDGEPQSILHSFTPTKPALVLLIDDDAFMRRHLRLCLDREGYEIVEAETGQEGLEIYSRISPDIVLLDAVMPGIDGFECCEKLQTLAGNRQVPILMITGLEDQVSVDRAFTAGATDFVTKPVHFAVLRQRVRRLIRQSQLQQELEAANRELLRLVSLDGLTQLANRRRFDEYLNSEWQRMRREQQPLALVLCDIDFFKSYNDTYGHQAGDRCLQQVARTLQSAAQRTTDLVARYGGEEFAILLPNTDVLGATVVAGKICATISALTIPHTSIAVHPTVTLSAGAVSLIPSARIGSDAFVAVADKALYRAKAQGRNRFCVGALDTAPKHL